MVTQTIIITTSTLTLITTTITGAPITTVRRHVLLITPIARAMVVITATCPDSVPLLRVAGTVVIMETVRATEMAICLAMAVIVLVTEETAIFPVMAATVPVAEEMATCPVTAAIDLVRVVVARKDRRLCQQRLLDRAIIAPVAVMA